MINFYFVDNPVIKALYKSLCLATENRIACVLIRKPYFARPKPTSPLVILALGVKSVHTGMVLAKACKKRNIVFYLSTGGRKRWLHFFRRDARFFWELDHAYLAAEIAKTAVSAKNFIMLLIL